MNPINSYQVNTWIDVAFARAFIYDPVTSVDSAWSCMGFIICLEDTPICWQEFVEHLTDNGLQVVVQGHAFEDNQGAYLLATQHSITAPTKYFLACFH